MSAGMLFSGDVYVDRLAADGSPQGRVLVGTGKLEVKPNAEQKDLISKGRDSYGQVIASVALPQPADFSIEFSEMDENALTMALMGTQAAHSVSAGTVTDEAVTARVGKWVDLVQANVSSVVVTDSTGATTYTEGTDYEVNARLGMIRVLSGGAINDGDSLLVDYSYGAESGVKITGITEPIIKLAILMDGRNLVNGRDCRVEVWEAQVTADAAIDFLSSDFLTASLKGRMITPSGKSGPIDVTYLD